MGGRGASASNKAFQILMQQPIIQPTQQIAQQANAGVFNDTDTQGYHDLYAGRQYFQKQNITIDEQISIVNYLSDTPENGSLYSMSQNMNTAMALGQPLTANQQYVHDNLMNTMHNLGYNLNLNRYDHETFVNSLLRQNGINQNYDKMSLSQLKSALIGKTYGEQRFVSTSYNDFKNAPPKTSSVFTNRAVKITYHANANVQAMMPGNGPGGKIGEIVLAPSGKAQNYTITDVIFTGKTASAKRTKADIPQIELVVTVNKQS